MSPAFLYSNRLIFIAGSPSLLKIELSDVSQLAQLLNVAVPADWPPGEYDRDAMQFFLEQLAKQPELIGWYNWYVITYPTPNKPATLVASVGYFGPPNTEGTLEIGYSVSNEWRRQGIATEIVSILVEHAWQQPGVQRIIAHTLPENEASIGVLTKNGFYEIESDGPEKRCFELLPLA
ncbi:GNAT family N-acetyltransferase [Spirosoma daeguense]